MKKTLQILFLLAIVGLSVTAQSIGGHHSGPMPVIKSGTMSIENIDPQWRAKLQHKISENDGPNQDVLNAIKAEKFNIKKQNLPVNSMAASDDNKEKSTASFGPVLGVNFQGNSNTQGCPQDNTIAISNGGLIASLVNSDIEYYNSSGAYINGMTLVNFYNDNTLSTFICDPKVIYDPQADRFIFYSQTCDGSSATSRVIISFSNTNDPSGLWTYYELTGNPMNDGSWFDYPKIAVSTDEVFITGNLFYDAGTFNQSVVYQIKKSDGYSQLSLTWQYWSNISGSPFTILPVGNGQSGNYGPPGIHLVNTFSNGGSSFNYYYIDNNLSNSPTMTYYSIPTTAYSVAGHASQSGTTHILDNGDCRAMNGFYLNGIIHFVFCCDIGSGWNGINYNRFTVLNQTNASYSFGSAGNFDYCYPAVASISSSSTDKSVAIAFVRSSGAIYPETRVVTCDDAGNWSNSVLVKAGDGYISNCYDSNKGADRWGDYSGISRKYNNNHVWMSGSYGNSSNYWNTWIAEIIPGTVGINEVKNNQPNTMNVYPNPISNLFTMDLYAPESGSIKASIYDETGKLVKLLYEGYIWKGDNTFRFDKGSLDCGIYFLTIENNNTIISHEKISIIH